MLNQPARPIASFDRTYDEALSLLIEARNYFQFGGGARRDGDAMARLIASCEAFRVTARLTQVMAWALVQKAVASGEMTREEAASEEHRLAGQEVCLDISTDIDDMPLGLRHLLDRSHALYQRTNRLDALLDHVEANGADPLVQH